MRRALTVVAVALGLAFVGTGSARATTVTSPDGAITVSVADIQTLPRTGCQTYTYTVSVTVPAGMGWQAKGWYSQVGGAWSSTDSIGGVGPTTSPVMSSGRINCNGPFPTGTHPKYPGPGSYNIHVELIQTAAPDTPPIVSWAPTITTMFVLPPKIATTLRAFITVGRPDIVRAYLSDAAGRVSGGYVTLWTHNATTTTWTKVGTVKTDANGWAYIDTQPRWWAAYRWTFDGNANFEPSISAVVAT